MAPQQSSKCWAEPPNKPPNAGPPYYAKRDQLIPYSQPNPQGPNTYNLVPNSAQRTPPLGPRKPHDPLNSSNYRAPRHRLLPRIGASHSGPQTPRQPHHQRPRPTVCQPPLYFLAPSQSGYSTFRQRDASVQPRTRYVQPITNRHLSLRTARRPSAPPSVRQRMASGHPQLDRHHPISQQSDPRPACDHRS
ncbi:hypothetical protein IHE45_11G047900 [Dioscorea alata]|uniref:Uncharacterized protein n=2 Tax=Dioscorea alata TaxID=55571 RepID=A0ACB7UAX4_DIOAL|nr:hypothetical protein IHE45_17G020600 [Dioscorea alata]KAH7669003.1 hypothetical protein IHE45_11G047900 [Dioscorea alata]